MIVHLLSLAILLSGPERHNRDGIRALARGDTAGAVASFESAARADSSRGVYAYNAGTAKALAGQDGDPELGRAVDLAGDPDEKARALYNRGTARLAKAASAPPGQRDPGPAIEDLRAALKLRPGWNDAARNLERALRLRPPPRKDQDKDPKGDKDGKRNDPGKGDKPDRPDSGKGKEGEDPSGKDGNRDRPQGAPNPAEPSGMDPRDAQRLLDGASAREAQQAREKIRKNREETDGPDW